MATEVGHSRSYSRARLSRALAWAQLSPRLPCISGEWLGPHPHLLCFERESGLVQSAGPILTAALVGF